jgi:hypothetical protein
MPLIVSYPEGYDQRQRSNGGVDEFPEVRLQRIAATAGKGLRPGGALAISRPSGRHAFGLLVTPLPRGNRYAAQGGAAAAVFVRDPDGDDETDAGLLRALFG